MLGVPRPAACINRPRNPVATVAERVGCYFSGSTTQRPYNKPQTQIEALVMCRKEGGVSFDPLCVDALIRFLESEEDTMHLGAQFQVVDPEK